MLNMVPALNGWFYKMPMGIPHLYQDNLDKIIKKCDPTKW